MEALFDKMKVYTKMEEEISAEEFQAYFKSVMDKLQKDFDALSQEELIWGKIIVSVMAGNAANRQKRKDADSKKFKKIQEKCKFWSDAIVYRLKKNGLSEKEIETITQETEAGM